MKHNQKYNTGESPVQNIVSMENISSAEYFFYKNEEPKRVLEDINLLIKRSEAWGINGRSSYEIKLLLEIMANIRPYDCGKCVLIERGMMRNKRTILKHVFYIGNSNMIYNNMNMLEFLMFAMGKQKVNKVELQDRIFEFIIDIGLGNLSLTPNRMLTKEENAVVELIAAAYSDCMMIVYNFPEYEFDETLINAIEKISVLIRDKGKALILGTQNSLLIEKTCSHTAFIADGRLIYKGTVDNLRFNYDKILVIIRDKNIYSVADKLAAILPYHKLSVKDDSLFVYCTGKEGCDAGYIYKKVAEAGITPDYMEINPKTVQNAYEEIILQYDLQKQLF
ncbi:lipopolysaccharide ABC transporter ATP-binding protein [Oxobacter pfennigii]|uniref:Lipopolysaccharide ABC transporter ATP-binding protein n=1 Tax=Oxobacter pfennigii TaxID=36849 RepID=A0A0P8WBB1_9CLOT|nr:hypothetical protein [Oxobacter pfennigii]KPU45917.1 lipopolysaccharide ABC transporter ATP-binding protein [Oxobacter pfennigii]